VVEEDPVTIVIEGVLVVATTYEADVDATEPSLKPEMKLGEYVAVPEYSGQPGTVVLTGALPPPQSRKSQISPLPGTYQRTLAPPYAITLEVVQPVRSVLAAESPAKAKSKMIGYILEFVIQRLSNARSD
jgi:hypothetical protein